MEETKNILQFSLSPKQIKFKDILSKEFVELEIYAISDVDPNRNGSHFTYESMKRAVESGSLKNRPIVGFFKNNDFTTHEGEAGYDFELEKEYWNTERGERILGWIRESDPVELVEENGLHWIKFRCVLCTAYCYSQVKRLLKDRRKKVSVEITVHNSEKREDGVVDLLDWTLNGTTILGSKNGKEVLEGIPGAHLSILENLDSDALMAQKQELSFAYEQAFGAKEDKSYGKEEIEVENETKNEFAEDDIGTKPALEVDKSKEAMSEKPWGEVNKADLRKRVIAAKNFKSIADDIFLDLREGWEDGIEGALKYPVMCLEGEKAVYNRGGLASAKAYAEKNNDEKVLGKLKKIYEHLELDEDEHEKEAAEHCEYCEDYDCKEGETSKMESEPCECPDDHGELVMEEPKPEHECIGVENMEENPEDDCGCDDEHDEDRDEDECDEMCKLQKHCDELEAKCVEYCGIIENMKAEHEAEMCKYGDYEEIKARMEKAEEELCKQAREEMKAYAESIMENEKIEKCDHDMICEKCLSGGYTKKEEIFADVAVAAFKNRAIISERFSCSFDAPAFGSEKVEEKKMTREERMKARVAKCGKK